MRHKFPLYFPFLWAQSMHFLWDWAKRERGKKRVTAIQTRSDALCALDWQSVRDLHFPIFLSFTGCPHLNYFTGCGQVKDEIGKYCRKARPGPSSHTYVWPRLSVPPCGCMVQACGSVSLLQVFILAEWHCGTWIRGHFEWLAIKATAVFLPE